MTGQIQKIRLAEVLTPSRLGFGVALAIVLLVEPAFAVDPLAEQPGFPWASWAVSVFNLLVFLGIIYKFGGPGITEYFKNRREKLLENLDQARLLREEAEARLQEYSARLDALETERQTLLEEYHRQGEREKSRLIAEAKTQIEKMRKDAEVSIDQEIKKAVADLEQQMVTRAVERAEDLARERMDAERQRNLVDDYVRELGTLQPSSEAGRAA